MKNALNYILLIIVLVSCTSSSRDHITGQEETKPDSHTDSSEPDVETYQKFWVADANEITAAMKLAQPGDTLMMRNKVWQDQHVVFAGHGQQGLPVILKAETPGQVILSGTSSLSIGGTYLTVDGLVFKNGTKAGNVIEFRKNSNELSDNCRLTNTVIENYSPDDGETDSKWISLYGSHNRVDHCSMEGKTNQGATLVVWLDGTPNYHQIDHNYFGPRPDLGRNGGETIRIGTSDWSQTDSYTTVEYNYFQQCDGEIEIISNKSGHNIYRRNTFYQCAGTLTLRHGNYAKVEENSFFGGGVSESGGIRVIGSYHLIDNNYFQDLMGTGLRAAISVMNAQVNPALNGYWLVDSAVISNNVMVNCKEGIEIGSGAGERSRIVPPKHITLLNNKKYPDEATVGNVTFEVTNKEDVGVLW